MSVTFDVHFNKKPVVLTVGPKAIYWKDQQGKLLGQYDVEDVAGAVGTADPLAIQLLAVPWKTGGCSGSKPPTLRQELKYSTFVFAQADQARDCIKTVRLAVRPGDLPRPRILVFANPYGGAKKAKPWYFKYVKPIFEAANIEPEVIFTARKDHAKDVFAGKNIAPLQVPTQPVTAYDGFVCISGDGLINECLHGIMENPNRDQLLQKPMGHIPGGTSNACAASQNCRDAQGAALLIAQQKTRPIDLVKVTVHRRTGNIYKYAFLVVQWGFAAEVNFASEKNRYLGPWRKNMVIMQKILKLNSYPGRITFHQLDPQPQRLRCKEGCERCQLSPQIDPATPTLPPQSTRDAAAAQPDDVKLLADPPRPVSPLGDVPDGHSEQVIEADILFMTASKCPDIAYDRKIAPYAHMSDGNIDLLIVRKGPGRCKLIDASNKTATGAHLDLPFFENFKVPYPMCEGTVDPRQVRSFHLEPTAPVGTPERSKLDVDGEVMEEMDPITVQVIPCAWNIYGIPVAGPASPVSAPAPAPAAAAPEPVAPQLAVPEQDVVVEPASADSVPLVATN